MWLLFYCKQKTAYEMRISDWSSDVCSSDLSPPREKVVPSTKTSDTDPSGVVVTTSSWNTGSPGAAAVALPSRRVSRSEERRVGNEGVSTGRSRGSAYDSNKV